MNEPQTHQPRPHPYAPSPAPPYPHPHPGGGPGRPVPEGVGDLRRQGAATVDGFLTLLGGSVLALRLPDGTDLGVPAGMITTSGSRVSVFAVVVCVVGVSFAHHVLGSVLFRTTVGKFLFFARVVREADAGRPRFWQSVRRWLLGLTWLPMQPVLALVGGDGDPYDDGCGLRIVRSKDLRGAGRAG
ncbi:RDD family protein [Streptomyces sp. NPDC018031]|uniref:RDD family protein n=1 Tax=Streptomyces sp. NPDC018031 TaxID=3365033 RepID=UPI0037A17ED7